MATAVLTVLLSFVLTGLVANRLVQRWQFRNWLSQQRLSDEQKDLQALQDVFDEISRLSSKRHHRMVRLLAGVRSLDTDKIQQRLTDYDAAVVEWNEHLNPMYAKLTMHLSFQLTKRLEADIHSVFVDLGENLVRLADRKISDKPIDSSELFRLEHSLNTLQGRLFKFDRDILRYYLERKRATLYGESLSENTLDALPTWELLKALFKPRIGR